MAPKRKKKKQLNLRSRIVNLIVEKGPIPQKGMTRILGASYQSLNTEILELRRLGVLEKDEHGVLSLQQGIDLAQYGIEAPVPEKNQGGAEASSSEDTYQAWCDGDFTNEEKFMRLLKSAGVKLAAEAIVMQFFAGNIWDIHFLYQVLRVSARGFVTEDQAKLIMSAWAYKWGSPFDFDEFFPE